MGRLFWKIFFFIWLAQLTAIWGIGGAAWLLHHNESQKQDGVDTSPPAVFFVESASATLQYGGLDALRSALKTDTPHPVYAVDENGQDLLGRQVAPAMIEQAQLVLKRDPARGTVRQIASSAHTYLLFMPEMDYFYNEPPPDRFASGHPEPDMHDPSHRPPGFLFPLFPVVATTVASLIFAALLAWYFSKPIRNLRSAFEAVAAGNFDVNLNSVMGKRRDDLSDLGRDFDRMADQLRALMEGQRRLLHDISHELRSPLARLQVAVGLARQQPEKLESSMERIEREIMRMDKLIGELLTLSKLDAGVNGTMQEAINPDELLADIVDDAQFEARAQGKKVELVSQCTTTLQGNAELLHRAIENVIRNAIKHTPDGASVKIETHLDTQHRQLHIAILDEGAGVPEAELDLIFEPFYRGSTAHKSIDGHGLGLAIARRILEAHGGNIQAGNRPAGGLCVKIRLPAAV